jgi:ribose transport system permease protein
MSSVLGPGRKYLGDAGVFVGIVALFIFFSLASPNFFEVSNFLNIGRQSVLLMLAAFAMTYVILIGEIDLSVATTASLAGVILALAMNAGLGLPLALLLGFLLAVVTGFINGVVTVKGRVPSFIVTLGMASVASGITITITGNRAVSASPETFLDLFARSQPLGVPIAVWYTLIIFALLHFLLTRTRFGMAIYAIGGNVKTARLSGIATDRVRIAVFTLAGAVIGVAAILQTARIGTATVEAARGLELDAIAAVVLGGTSFSGGRGSLLRTVLGVLLIGILNNGLSLMNVLSYYQFIIKGAIVVLAVLLDRWTR